MKKKHNFLSALLVLCMMFMLVPTAVFAVGETNRTFKVDGIRYLITGDSTVSVIGTGDIADSQLPPGTEPGLGLGLGQSTYSGEINIPETVLYADTTYSVTGIYNNSFAGTNVTRVSVPSSVTVIGASAFKNCFELTEVQLREGLHEIGTDAFSYCSALAVLDIPSTVTKIGTSAFGLCRSLMSLNIPAGVTDNLVQALVGNSIYPYLDKVTIAEGSPYEIDGGVLYKGTIAQLYMGTEEHVVVREGTTGLASAQAGDFSQYSGYYGVFSHNTTLKSVILPNTITSVPARTFYSAVNMESVTLPEGITEIEESTFYNTGLPSIDIPDSVERIGNYAFQGSIRMPSIELPSRLQSIGDGVFKGSGILNNITIPEGITTIPKDAFSGCASLDSISLPTGIDSIGESAFDGTALTSFVIPEGVTTIPKNAFSNVTTLTTVVIPASVTSIGRNAFSGLMSDASHTTLIFQGSTAPTIDKRAFGSIGSIPTGLTVIVPDGAEDAYMADGYILKDFVAGTDGEGAKPGISYRLNLPDTETIHVGDQSLPNSTITVPEGATVEYSSSDESVASVRYENGELIIDGKTCGTTTITAGIRLHGVEIVSASCEATIAHTLEKTDAKKATCTEDGNIEYWTCSVCDKLFADATGTIETTIEAVTIKATKHNFDSQWLFDETNHWRACTCGAIIDRTGHDLRWIVDQEATLTESGSKHPECSICDYVGATVEIPATGQTTPDYQIVEGENGSWTQHTDGTLTFRANGDFADFVGVKVDDNLIDTGNYTAQSGSTVITLKANYLKTLSQGEHKVTFVFTDGECSTSFTIKAAQSTTPGSNIPATADTDNLMLWLAMMAGSIFGMVFTFLYDRKRKVGC